MHWSLCRLVGPAIPFLTDDQLARVLAMAATVDEWDHAEVLTAAARANRLSDRQLQESVATVRRFASASAKVRGLTGLMPHISGDTREIAWKDAVEACHAFDNDPVNRARALAEFVGAAIPPLQAQLVTEALTAAGAIDDAESRVRAPSALFKARHLDRTSCLHAFERMLESASRPQIAGVYGSRVRYTSLGRSFLLQCVADSASSIADLGGEAAVEECFHAIRDAGTWWP